MCAPRRALGQGENTTNTGQWGGSIHIYTYTHTYISMCSGTALQDVACGQTEKWTSWLQQGPLQEGAEQGPFEEEADFHAPWSSNKAMNAAFGSANHKASVRTQPQVDNVLYDPALTSSFTPSNFDVRHGSPDS